MKPASYALIRQLEAALGLPPGILANANVQIIDPSPDHDLPDNVKARP
jgi:hypothetical protein